MKDDAYELLAQRYAELEQEKAELAELLDRAETERDALAAHQADLVRELTSCQAVLHSLAHSGEVTSAYADDAKAVLTRTKDISLARRDAELILWLADGLEAAEAPSAESGDMWDASQCADWIREQADTAEQGES
ncbi:hypothetical protein RSO41_13555 [Halomonas sp. I1]|uniref:hypothetical protein n=1 Tax=Halomonas sp. I1 TaxID=393536 RepID=UPI0028DDB0DB|nr:hypothetical protein [Halomonas sp. I1]MDT8895678.1 hypothetical protein [Halomonas sp. I1]